MAEPRTNPSRAKASTGRKQPPHLSSYSLLGSASLMLRDPLGFLLATRRYGEIVGMRFVFSPAYLIYHLDDVRHVLLENHSITIKTSSPTICCAPSMEPGSSLTTVNPGYTSGASCSLLSIATLMMEATDAMLESWLARQEADGPLDIDEEMMRLTLRIVGQALFSIDLSHETRCKGAL